MFSPRVAAVPGVVRRVDLGPRPRRALGSRSSPLGVRSPGVQTSLRIDHL